MLASNPDHQDDLPAAQVAYLFLADTLIQAGEDNEALARADHLATNFPSRDQGLRFALCFLARCASGADAKLASEQSQVFVRRAEQLVQAAFKEGRTRGLQLARDDE